jgi:chaperonin GroEL
MKFNEQARQSLHAGIKKMALAVGSTLGPRGNTVVLNSNNHAGGFTVTKDGVTVARAIKLEDATEDLAVRIMRQAAELSASKAGDGTTTAIVLAAALIDGGMEAGLRLADVRGLSHLAQMASDELSRMSVPVEDISSVATISASGDKEIGSLIARAYEHVGPGGIVVVQKGMGTTVTLETSTGLRFTRGYTSRVFVNEHERDMCDISDAYILVTDTPINNILHIEGIIRGIISSGKPLLIVGDVSDQVTMTLAANVVKNGMKFCVVKPPSFGWRRQEAMEDLALMTGARLFSEATGDDLSSATVADLGRIARAQVGKDETTLMLASTPDVSERIEQIRRQNPENAEERIAMLQGAVSVIHVGARTDVEQKELHDRIDDAVCAVRSALEEGIVPGGGVALHNIADTLPQETALEKVFAKALRAPAEQIADNAGAKLRIGPGKGTCLQTDRYGDMVEMGVIDPTKVTRSALAGAVSVAMAILGSNAVVE